MTACFVLLWLNETRLSLPHFSITVRSLEKSLGLVTAKVWIAPCCVSTAKDVANGTNNYSRWFGGEKACMMLIYEKGVARFKNNFRGIAEGS